MDETTEALSPRIINRSCVFYLPNEYKIPSLDNYFQSDHYPISYQSLRKILAMKIFFKTITTQKNMDKIS